MSTLIHSSIAIKAKADNTTLTIRYGPGLMFTKDIETDVSDSADLLASKINNIKYPEDLVWLGYFVAEVGPVNAMADITNAIIVGSS